MLKGRLTEFGLGEILQSLAINRHTGTLFLTAPSGARKLIYFSKGDITLFSHGRPETPRLGEMLVRDGKLTQAQLDEALRKQRRTSNLLGKILTEEELVSEGELTSCLQRKIQEEIYELFLWTEGEFEFHIDELASELFDALQKSLKIVVNTNTVIMEGLRRLDEWQKIRERIPSTDVIFKRIGAAPESKDSAELEVLELVDGKRSAGEVCDDYLGPRYECLRALHSLVEKNAVAPLTIDEIRAEADVARRTREYRRLATLLRFAVDLCPDEPLFFHELGDCLLKCQADKTAEKAYIEALRLYFDQGQLEKAAAITERLSPTADLDERGLTILFRTALKANVTKKAVWAGTRLATVLRDAEKEEKAVEVLESLARLEPGDLNLRVEIGILLKQCNQKDRAREYFEEVVKELDEQKKVRDQIKVLRLLADLCPDRSDLHDKITSLSTLRDRMDRRRKRRVALSVAALLLLLGLSLVAIIYEIKARELFQHAKRLEGIAIDTLDFSQAKSTYSELLSRYPLSTRASSARDALARIDDLEKSHQSLEAMHAARRREEDEAQRTANMQKLTKLLRGANLAEKRGDFAESHRLCVQARAVQQELPGTDQVLLPLHIVSNPPKAKVEVDGLQVGVTPLVLRYEPHSEHHIELSLVGCHSRSENVKLTTQHELRFELERRPVDEFRLSAGVEQPLVRIGSRVIYLSRDGTLRSFHPQERAVEWELAVGRFGDRVSDFVTRGRNIYLSTVDGEVLAVDARSGKKQWSGRVDGPVLAAPAISPDGKWLALGTLQGKAFLLDRASGKVNGVFATENEIVVSPVFVGERLVVGSTDSHVYVYNVRQRKLEFIREVSDSVTARVVSLDGAVLLPTEDGRVHRLDLVSQKIVWSEPVGKHGIDFLILTDTSLLAVLPIGTVHKLDPSTGKRLGTLEVGNSRPGGVAYHDGHLYLGFQNGDVRSWDLEENELAWSWHAGESINVSPLVAGTQLFVLSASGGVRVLEMLE